MQYHVTTIFIYTYCGASALLAELSVSRRCTQLLDLYAAFYQEITWHQHSDLSIGCQLSSGLNSSSACLSIRPAMNSPTSRIDLIETTSVSTWRASNRSASNYDLDTRGTRVKLSERAPRVWNQLPIDIKAATDAQAFKIENAFVLGSLPEVKLMIRRRSKSICHLWNIEMGRLSLCRQPLYYDYYYYYYYYYYYTIIIIIFFYCPWYSVRKGGEIKQIV